MTSRKLKSINRDDIELYIDINDDLPEVMYNNYVYFLSEIKNHDWQFLGSTVTNNIKASQIDLILYSDIIDSFIEFYTSINS